MNLRIAVLIFLIGASLANLLYTIRMHDDVPFMARPTPEPPLSFVTIPPSNAPMQVDPDKMREYAAYSKQHSDINLTGWIREIAIITVAGMAFFVIRKADEAHR